MSVQKNEEEENQEEEIFPGGSYRRRVILQPSPSSLELPIRTWYRPASAVLSELAQTATKDVQQTGAKLLAHKDTFYVNAAHQSRQSFFLACIVGLIGLLLIIAAVLIGLFTDKVVVSLISGVSGISFEVLAGFILQLYKQASVQLATFHQSIDDMHRFLVANSICESLESDRKEETRSTLVLDIACFTRNQGKSETKEPATK